MASDTFLEVSNLTLRKQDKALLAGLGFALQKGRFYGLLGPNGAGKSSLLRLLYRADRPTSGKITLDGRDIGTIPRRAYATRVGALVQEQVNLSGLSLREVVRLGLLPLRLSADKAAKRIDAALSEVGLLSRIEDDAARLSGGEQQRVFFAQLLALDPELYLLDEPHNHLDLHFQYRLLDKVSRQGRTVLASFHDINLAARYCDEILLLDHGTMVAQGAAETVLTRERLAEIYRIDGHFTDGQLSVAGAL